jgi:hypothetical protein
MAKKLDPNHPTSIVLAGATKEKITDIRRFCPDVDIISINTYGGLRNHPKKWAWDNPTCFSGIPSCSIGAFHAVIFASHHPYAPYSAMIYGLKPPPASDVTDRPHSRADAVISSSRVSEPLFGLTRTHVPTG